MSLAEHTMSLTEPAAPSTSHDWREAGEAWGHAAIDWTTLNEHYATDILLAVIDKLDISPDMHVLDIACGNDIEIDHACGGVCACSTCHVIVEAGAESCNESTDAEESAES